MGRPTQLGRAIVLSLAALLVISFISGLGLWWVHEQKEKLLDAPGWTSLCRAIHGLANPWICILYGWLWYSHIPGGWRMGVNRKSGATVAGSLGGLILSGAAIYYTDQWRHAWFTTHLLLGLIFPVAVAVHWRAARKWARTQN